MRSLIQHLRVLRSHEAKLTIEEETSAALSLMSGRTPIVFDRLSRAVIKNGRQVATFGSIHSVRIDAEANEDRPAVWLVILQMTASRALVVGRTSNSSEASVAAARIAAITGTRVLGK